jgi:hypothetical protein
VSDPPAKRPRWWENGLVWISLVVAVALALVPPAGRAVIDLRHVSCDAPVENVKPDRVIAADDVKRQEEVRRGDLPPGAVTEHGALAGRTAAKPLAADHCVVADDLDPLRVDVALPLAQLVVPDDLAAGDRVDIALAPTGDADRPGTLVERAVVTEVGELVLVVGVTPAERGTLLDNLGRAVVVVTPGPTEEASDG